MELRRAVETLKGSTTSPAQVAKACNSIKSASQASGTPPARILDAVPALLSVLRRYEENTSICQCAFETLAAAVHGAGTSPKVELDDLKMMDAIARRFADDAALSVAACTAFQALLYLEDNLVCVFAASCWSLITALKAHTAVAARPAVLALSAFAGSKYDRVVKATLELGGHEALAAAVLAHPGDGGIVTAALEGLRGLVRQASDDAAFARSPAGHAIVAALSHPSVSPRTIESACHILTSLQVAQSAGLAGMADEMVSVEDVMSGTTRGKKASLKAADGGSDSGYSPRAAAAAAASAGGGYMPSPEVTAAACAEGSVSEALPAALGPALVSALRLHVGDYECARSLTVAIASLITRRKHVRALCSPACRAWEPLVAQLQSSFVDNFLIAESAMSALAGLALSDSVCEAMAAAGVGEAIMRVLNRQSGNREAVRSACYAIRGLSAAPGVRSRLMSAGVAAALITVLKAHIWDPDIAIGCCGTFRNLAATPEYRGLLRLAGAVTAAASVLKMYGDAEYPDAPAAACSALFALACEPGNCAALQRAGVPALLLAVLPKHGAGGSSSSNAMLGWACCGVLYKMIEANIEKGRAKAGSSGSSAAAGGAGSAAAAADGVCLLVELLREDDGAAAKLVAARKASATCVALVAMLKAHAKAGADPRLVRALHAFVRLLSSRRQTKELLSSHGIEAALAALE